MKPLDEIAGTIESMPEVLRCLLNPIDPEALRGRPEPGEWCAMEVVGHLIVTDGPGFRDRIQAIIDGEPEIKGFDPSLERTGRDFQSADLEGLLDELATERTMSGAFLRSLDTQTLERTANYKSNGIFAAADFVHEWPFHDQDHLQQILATIKPSYLPHMTETMRSALLD